MYNFLPVKGCVEREKKKRWTKAMVQWTASFSILPQVCFVFSQYGIKALSDVFPATWFNNSNYQLIPVTSCNVVLRSFLGWDGVFEGLCMGRVGLTPLLSFILIFNCIVLQTSTRFEMTFW